MSKLNKKIFDFMFKYCFVKYEIEFIGETYMDLINISYSNSDDTAQIIDKSIILQNNSKPKTKDKMRIMFKFKINNEKQLIILPTFIPWDNKNNEWDSDNSFKMMEYKFERIITQETLNNIEKATGSKLIKK
ncbi:MAG: hypothetical protein KIT69_06690 [Propionibacteriaceae bacterium]|nr:hypothetical protein [Propionibacteriaceae bacterium]